MSGLPLPAGLLPTRLALSTDERLVSAVRESSIRYELLDRDEAPLGELLGVRVGGSIDWVANASIKGSATITVDDVGQNVDWLNVRVRPVVSIVGYGEMPLGIWIPAAPVEAYSDLGLSRDVEFLDKNSILDTDVYDDDDSDLARAYSAPVNSNVTRLVLDLIEGAGESGAAIELGDETLSSPMLWEVGTTRLKIINDLLDAAGYFSLYVDLQGAYRATRYVPPAQRPVAFELLAPFSVGPTSVMTPDFKRDNDIYSVPNRFVAVSQGDGEAAGLVSTAKNTDPNSPFSYPARGRWITSVETGVEAVDQSALDVYASRKLTSATSVASSFDISHLPLPGLRENAVLRLVRPEADVDLLCTVSKTTYPLDPLEAASSTLQEVLDL